VNSQIAENSQQFAAQKLDGLFVFTRERSFPPTAVAALGQMLNTTLESLQLNRLPIVTVIYSHAYSESQSWKKYFEGVKNL